MEVVAEEDGSVVMEVVEEAVAAEEMVGVVEEEVEEGVKRRVDVERDSGRFGFRVPGFR